MIVHDINVQASVQPFCTSHTENANNLDSFSRLIIMNGQVVAENFYTIDTTLTALVTKHG